jgi:hypothetical protein
MSHVDEGQLHAYLDGALGSADARAQVEDHLRLCADCRSRLDAARRDREEAGQILALLDPGEVRVPPMEELQRDRRGEGRGEPGSGRRGGPARGAGSRRSGPAVPLRLAWAASVLLALGGGWMLRSAVLPGGDGAPSTVASSVVVAETRGAAEALAAPAPSTPVPAAPPVAEAPTVAGRKPARDPAPEPAPEPTMEPAMDAVAVAGDLALEERPGEIPAWVNISPAAAAELLGQPPLELEGIPWERLEVLETEGQVLVRSFHPLDDGVRIELLQGRRQGEGAPAEAGAFAGGSVQTRSLPEPPVQASRLVQERMRAGAEADAPVPLFPPAGDEPEGHAVVRAERDGVSFLLRGPVDRGVLDGLVGRVR